MPQVLLHDKQKYELLVKVAPNEACHKAPHPCEACLIGRAERKLLANEKSNHGIRNHTTERDCSSVP